jgi:RNA polymerase sigma factor (sigma-70 family)
LLADAQAYLRRRLSAAEPVSLLCLRWEQFYHTCDELLRRFVSSFHLDEDMCDEVVQMVWCKLITRLSRFDWNAKRSGLRRYLYVMLRNKAADVLREREQYRLARLDDPSVAEMLIDPDASPVMQLQKRFQQALVETVLAEVENNVSELTYRVFCLRLFEGRSVGQVAAALRLRPQSVWYRYYRVLRRLRRRVRLHGRDTLEPEA